MEKLSSEALINYTSEFASIESLNVSIAIQNA